ncbi:hypothetical protein FRC10_002659 [Ceratobasidium sp. 414]|nr:hypothetical protein FRC10_002659 [Ceratobasidium sp. 414]
MATVYRPNGAASASDSQPSLDLWVFLKHTLFICIMFLSRPLPCVPQCSPDGRRPLRRDTHVTSPPGQPLRGRWEVDTSETSVKSAPALSHKALKVLCGEGADLQLETRGKAPLEARIQITGRGWTHPQIEAVTEYGDGIVEMVRMLNHMFDGARHGSQRFRLTARTLGGNMIVRIPADFSGKIVATSPGSVTLSPNAARLLSGPRTTTVSAGGSVVEYSTGPGDADGKPLRFPDSVHVSPGEGSVRVLVGDEGLIRANGLVAGVLGAKQWAEDEMARRRSSSRRP